MTHDHTHGRWKCADPCPLPSVMPRPRSFNRQCEFCGEDLFTDNVLTHTCSEREDDLQEARRLLENPEFCRRIDDMLPETFWDWKIILTLGVLMVIGMVIGQ